MNVHRLLLCIHFTVGLSISEDIPFLNDYVPINFRVDSVGASSPRVAAARKSSAKSGHASDGGSFRLTFMAYNRSFELELRPSMQNTFSSAATVSLQGVGQIQLQTQHLLTGSVVGDATSEVFGWMSDGVFQGSIQLGTGEVYYIESSRKFATSRASQAILYKDSDLRRTNRLQSKKASLHPFRCGTRGEPRNMTENSAPTRRKRETADARRTCLIHFKVDQYYWKLIFEREGQWDINKTVSEITGTINQLVTTTNSIYKSTEFGAAGSGYNFKVAAIEVETPESCKNSKDPLCVEPNSTSFFTLHFHSCFNYDQYCLSFLITNRVFEESTVGLAFTPTLDDRNVGICSRHTSKDVILFKEYIAKTDAYTEMDKYYGALWKKYADVDCPKQNRNTGLITASSEDGILMRRNIELTFAHEVGHTFGSDHDPHTCTPDNTNGGLYIMAAYLMPGDQPNNGKFSPCSIAYIEENLRSIHSNYSTERYDCFVNESDTSDTDSVSPPSDSMSTVVLSLIIAIPASVVVLAVVTIIAVVVYMKVKRVTFIQTV